MCTCLKVRLWAVLLISLLRITSVQLSSLRIPTVQYKSATKQESAMVAWFSRTYQASRELASGIRSYKDQPECQEFSALFLSTKSRSVQRQDQGRIAQLATQGPFHCLCVLFIISPNLTCPPLGLASAKHHVSLHHMTKPESRTSTFTIYTNIFFLPKHNFPTHWWAQIVPIL